jgi:hypothetical protein
MNESEIQEWIDKGHLHARAIIEVLGKPKEHVEQTIKDYVGNIAKDPHVKIVSTEFAPAEEQPEQLFSTFVELEFLVKGVSKLVGFCFDYMPSSIEVLAPEHIAFNHMTVTEFVNDLQEKLHRMDAILKNQDFENQFLKKNLHLTVQNLLTLVLYNRELDEEQLVKATGIHKDSIKTYLDELIKENKVKIVENKYTLV